MKKNNTPSTPLFQKENYMLLIAGIVIIALGFLLMSGGGSDDPNVFNNEVFSFRRIRLAPTVVFIGFGVCIFSIFKNPKKKTEDN